VALLNGYLSTHRQGHVCSPDFARVGQIPGRPLCHGDLGKRIVSLRVDAISVFPIPRRDASIGPLYIEFHLD
jgi:hypothetical protein